MRDARCVGSPEATLPASRIPPPEKCATPLTIGYSFPHTGQPSMPDRTIRPSISPVDNTRKPSSCRSGQRSISVSSMCTRAELHPRNAVRFDAHAARHASSPHGYGERVLARLDIRNGEVLPVVGVGMIVLAVRFGVGVGRLLRLCLDQPVHAHLLCRLALRIPHPPRHDSRPGQRTDPELGVHRVLREPLVRIDDQDRKSTRLNSSHGYISYAVFCLKKKK